MLPEWLARFVMKTSSVEQKFLDAWNKYTAFPEGDPEREYVFTLEGDEKYRLDFAWPSLKVGVEIQGLGFGHQRIAGIKRDADKLRLALEYGWTVLQFTSACLGSEADRELAIWQVCNQLFEKGNLLHEPFNAQTGSAPKTHE